LRNSVLTTLTDTDVRADASAVASAVLRGAMYDVTQQRHIESELQQQARLFQAVFNHAPDPMSIVSAERIIQSVNPALERVFGYQSEEVVGQTTAVLYADKQEWERLGRARFNTEFSLSSGPGETPTYARFRRKNGEIFPVEIYGDAIRDAAGETLGYLGVMHDVTHQMRVRDELRDNEERFRAFASAGSDWYWEMDAQLRFSYFSEPFTRVTGVAAEQLLGKTRQETRIAAVDDKTWTQHMEDLAAHRPFRQFVHSSTHTDGKVVWLAISGVPHFAEDGAFCGYRGSGSDITAQVHMEQALRDGEARFRQFAEMGADYYWETDEQMVFTSVYGRWGEFWGAQMEELIGKPRDPYMLIALGDAAAAEHARMIADHQPFTDLELRPPQADGVEKIVLASGSPVFDESGTFRGYRGASRDVTLERYMADQLAHQAAHDVLTGLENRRAFEQRLERVLQRAENSLTGHCLCYLDLDQFKVVNDTCGHAAGDELLRQVSSLLLEHIRTRDMLARLGGDEFGILLENCQLSGARVVAENIREALARFRFAWESKVFTIGVSIGVVSLTAGVNTVAQALSAADSACYVAKDNGRNHVHVHDGVDVQVTMRNSEMQWVERVSRAIEEDRLELWHQPIVRVAAGVDGGEHFEVLLRMRDEDGKILAPGLFLPAAERYDIASRIDRWVLSKTLHWLRTHPDQLARIALCSVNISGQSLSEDSFLDFARDALGQEGVPPQQICFEITETAAIRNLGAAKRFIRTIKGLGCRFALDDFGSGLSSFAYLKTLDVDFLKIDGMFVKDMDTDAVSLAMVRSINEVAHVMGKRTIAEFVENDAILERLGIIGVDFAQGYGIGHPVPLNTRLRSAGESTAGVVTPFRR
jgi:diguanylate cyclase (GGDEF)-like protein/PAS domain S-box-containing protein